MNYSSSIQKGVYDRAPYFIKNILSSGYGLFQKRKRCGKYYRYYLDFLSESQWYKNDQLKELQFKLTKDFLVFAFKRSEYYRKLFVQYGFNPASIKSLSDMQILPVLNKEYAREHIEEIFPSNINEFSPYVTHTSGTTGLGLKLFESKECFEREFAFRINSYSWGGVKFGNRWAWCAGHPVSKQDSDKPPFWVHDVINNWLLMSSYHMSEKNLPAYIYKLARFKPELLAGYPSSIYLLAVINYELGKIVNPKAIVTSSETLFDYQRDIIGKSFGCKVYSYYGNAERAAVFSECEKGSYHLREEYSFVELLDENNLPVKDGNKGILICTGFGNYATPLIRYRIGDEAIFSKENKCACGRSGKIVESIIGRIEDYIVTPEGRYIGRLDHLFKDSINVRMAQIVQNKVSEITIKIVQKTGYGKKDELEILTEARKRLGSGINISFDYVKDIPRSKNGKFKFINSTLEKRKGIK